ncbi:2Fe-2S iron-sulfur cluster binding domain-containing protein [Hyphomicrobium sp. ghe19]|uniref:2Fe-2S iron-sulfur cluster binding domain-containing protein n=1 Tax=Hyphomicrobium sp. ghe19 TaxID=2682968 RepID=UPI00136681E5|nr:Putative methanesulfonate monooxygenase ferredoxin reductase subunit [Hyphomicrobium sp. ghe19]
MNSTMISSVKAEYLLPAESSATEDRVAITVQTPTGAFEFPCENGETLLHAGLKSGLTLPYECATGTCGSCRGRLMTGEIVIGWEESPALAKLKREKGDILLCQAKAMSDCLVRVPAKITQISTEDAPANFRGTICDSRVLTRDVMEFAVDLSTPMSFEAGQFALIGTPSVVGARAYSMVNYADRTGRIEFVVKRKPGGGFCNWLFSEPVDGTEIDIFGPLGRATFEAGEDRDLIIAAGGSGIAGMMSILERATQLNHFASHRGHVFFGVPTLQDGFYLDELSKYVRKAQGNLDVTLALSNEPPETARHPNYDEIQLAGGFVHTAMASSMAGRYQNTLAYLAGPPPMVDAALRILISDGQLSPEAIRYDKFG